MSERRQAFTAGLQAVAPMLPGVVPFGMTAGVAGLDAGLGGELAFAMSVVIFAGASQIASAQLLGAEAAPALVVLTALLINLRMVMYSASLAPHFAPLPLRWRLPMAYLLTEAAGVDLARLGAGAVALLVAWRTHGALATVAAGMATLWLLRGAGL